jgi:hypothetical protein
VHATGADGGEAGYCCARNCVVWKACEVVDGDAQLRAEKTFGPPCMDVEQKLVAQSATRAVQIFYQPLRDSMSTEM